MIKMQPLAVLLLVMLSWGCAQKVSLVTGKEEMESFAPRITAYGYLEAKAKLVLEENSGKITRGTLQLRAKKDSLIWFSVSPGLGVEALRGLLSQEKIQIVNRMGTEDINLSYGEFERRYGIKLSLGLVQNILWGDPPYPASYEDRLVRVGKKFELTQVRDQVRYFSKVDTRHGKVSELSSISIAGKGSLLASFPEYQNLATQAFPVEALFKVAFETPEVAQNFRIYITWSSLNPKADPLTFPFRF
ncbi:MAG: DUF4292 domain-containing protein [Bacteroidetes bacterium]|nr:DUF4292 domain-containing protein [Bacteroidota bacterium]